MGIWSFPIALATQMSSRGQRSIQLGGRCRQVSLCYSDGAEHSMSVAIPLGSYVQDIDSKTSVLPHNFTENEELLW